MFSYFKNSIDIFVQQDETFLLHQDVEIKKQQEDLAEKRFNILKEWDEFLKERKDFKNNNIFNPDDFKPFPGNKRMNPFRPLSHIVKCRVPTLPNKPIRVVTLSALWH